jgi:hypothetical protein
MNPEQWLARGHTALGGQLWDSTSRGEIPLAVAESWRIRQQSEKPPLEYRVRVLSRQPTLEF